MGMFDDLRCEWPLPSHPEMQGRTFQTKDTPSQYLDPYLIDREGRLCERVCDYEDVPGEVDAFGFKRRRAVNCRWIPLSDFHGDVLFYDFERMGDRGYSDARSPMVHFRARFTDGRLTSLKEVPDPWDGAREREGAGGP